MKTMIVCFTRGILIAVAIIAIAYLVAFKLINDPKQLDLTLFALGAIPIVLFLPSLFSQAKSGALHTPRVIFRKVDTLKRNRNVEAEKLFPALSYVIAGLMTWVFSSIVY